MCVFSVAEHASVAERLHARYRYGDVYRVSVTGVLWYDISRSRRVSSLNITPEHVTFAKYNRYI